MNEIWIQGYVNMGSALPGCLQKHPGNNLADLNKHEMLWWMVEFPLG